MDRREIFERDEHRCVYCGERFPEDALTVDHVEPRRKGGDGSRGNVVTACAPCNRDKGGMTAWRYLSDRPEKRATFLRLARHLWPRLREAVVEAAEGPEDD